MLIDKSKYPIFATLDGIWKLYPNLHNDCSGFLKKVAQQLCVVMSTGNANAIVAYLQKTLGWMPLGHDSVKAADLAAKGYLVIAGTIEPVHGHVAVIVPGWSPNGCPMGYWGQLGGIGKANASLSWAWVSEANWDSPLGQKAYPHKKGTPAPLDEVLYFALPLTTLNPVTKK